MKDEKKQEIISLIENRIDVLVAEFILNDWQCVSFGLIDLISANPENKKTVA